MNKKVWAVIGAEGLKGTFKLLTNAMVAMKAANYDGPYKVTLQERGLRNVLFMETERVYVVKQVTEADALFYLKDEQNGRADFSHEYSIKSESAAANTGGVNDYDFSLVSGFLTDLLQEVSSTLNEYGLILHNTRAMLDFAEAARTVTANEPTKNELDTAYASVQKVRFYVVDVVNRIKAQRERERQEREERERMERERVARVEARRAKVDDMIEQIKGNGFTVNRSAIIDSHFLSEDYDKGQILSQLSDAPLFREISVHDMYKKRAHVVYELTGGAQVLEARAVDVCDYMQRFFRELGNAINEQYYKLTYSDFTEWARFWKNDSIIRQGITDNRIDSLVMEQFNIRSPKFSKHLIKTFGEKSTLVKMFNDRPKPEELEKETAETVDGVKLYVSNLACNVMKMTANNHFSSCQDYTYENESDLEYLQKLPSSVHDETMSIAYLVNDSDDYENPNMLARVLIAPFYYREQLFFIGFNVYDYDGNADILKASLKNLYGGRFLFADDMYHTNNMAEYVHNYDYSLRVDFELENECYMCEGSGQVEVEVRYHGYRFETECPCCEGSGNGDGGSYGDYPYVNNGAFVRYNYGAKVTRADEEMIIALIESELTARNEQLYGGKDLLSNTIAGWDVISA